MKSKRLMILGLAVLLFLCVLASSSLHHPASANPAISTSFTSDPLTNPDGSYWVVRAYYQDRQMVNELARWLEPWEVHHDQGYLVVGVNQQQYDLLLTLGFRLEIDQQLTDLMNQPHLTLPGQISGIPGYPCYRTVEETLAAVNTLVSSYPQLASKVDIGDSWDKTAPGGSAGYDMVVLKLTNSAITGSKPKLFLMAGIHAREYATAELITRFAEQLVTSYNTYADSRWLLDHNEIHLLLQTNPDGRKYAETGISWRKNTNQNYCSPTSNYRGADLNRNFSFQWGCCGGSSGSQCAETYRGPTAGSEPETQAVQNYVRSQFPDQRGPGLTDPAPADAMGVFLDIHSYSELVLWPWGFTYSATPNAAALQTLGRKFAFFNQYYPDQAVGLYITDGTTDDFAYGELGIAAYTFEIGTSFFQDCTTFESTILPNNLPALYYAAKAARTPYQTPAGPDVTDLPYQLQVEQGTAVTLTAVINDTRYNNTNGSEATQNISAAEYLIDTPPWAANPTSYPMAATDGVFNAKIEGVNATINTSQLSVGKHIVFVRGQDTSGRWGAVSAVFLQINRPAYLVSLSPTSSLQVGDAGEIITHTLHITNAGGQSDTYTVTLSSEWSGTMLLPNGSELPSGGSVTLASGKSTTLRVQILAPALADPGDQSTAQVMLTSWGNPTLSRSAELTSLIGPAYLVSLDPTNSLKNGAPGDVITHTLYISNTGGQSDTYTVTLSSVWPGIILLPNGDELPSGGSITLASRQSILLRVLIYAPALPVPENPYTAQITIVSQGDPSLSLSASLTSWIWWHIFMPLLR